MPRTIFLPGLKLSPSHGFCGTGGFPEGGIGSELGESLITGRDGSGISSVAGKFESDHDGIDSGGMTMEVCSRGVSGCCGTSPGGLDGTLAREGIMRGSIAGIPFSIG